MLALASSEPLAEGGWTLPPGIGADHPPVTTAGYQPGLVGPSAAGVQEDVAGSNVMGACRTRGLYAAPAGSPRLFYEPYNGVEFAMLYLAALHIVYLCTLVRERRSIKALLTAYQFIDLVKVRGWPALVTSRAPTLEDG